MEIFSSRCSMSYLKVKVHSEFLFRSLSLSPSLNRKTCILNMIEKSLGNSWKSTAQPHMTLFCMQNTQFPLFNSLILPFSRTEFILTNTQIIYFTQKMNSCWGWVLSFWFIWKCIEISFIKAKKLIFSVVVANTQKKNTNQTSPNKKCQSKYRVVVLFTV